MNTPPTHPPPLPANYDPADVFSEAAVTESIDLLVRLIAQEHHRCTAEKLGFRPSELPHERWARRGD